MPTTKSSQLVAPVVVSLKSTLHVSLPQTPFNLCFPPHSVSVPGTHAGSCRIPFRSHEWIEAKGAQPKALRASSEIVQ